MPNTLNILQGSSVDYKLFKCESPQRNQSIELNCFSDKEAAKLFGMYLDHRHPSPKLEESENGLKVQVLGENMTCTYELVACQKQIIC